MKFLDILDVLMKKNNMRHADLARAIGLPQTTVNSWYARGTARVDLDTLKKIADYFGVSLEYLVNGADLKKLVFTEAEYTAEELSLIRDFAEMLQKRRLKQ